MRNVSRDEVDFYLLHQATLKMLQQLQQRLGLDDNKLPICLEKCGNTVSSTIPILISDLQESNKIQPDSKNVIIGFGVGWSWAGCIWRA